MTSIAQLLNDARRRIAPAEARWLLAHLLGCQTAWLEAHRDDLLDDETAARFSALVVRREAGEPIAYLTGSREFYGREFIVTPDVLIPRPETELLVDLALQKIGAGKTAHILDLGVGSGCVAITLALELANARLTAVDTSAAALAVARANAARLGAEVEFLVSDWFAVLPPRTFDLIVANPPYIAAGDPHLAQGDLRFEPAAALTDGADGLSAIRRIVMEAPSWLNEGGWLLLEHGWDQGAAVHALLTAAGFTDIGQWRDLAGIIRVSGGRRAARRNALAAGGNSQ